MSYRRANLPGASYLFTVFLVVQKSSLLLEHVDVLRESVSTVVWVEQRETQHSNSTKIICAVIATPELIMVPAPQGVSCPPEIFPQHDPNAMAKLKKIKSKSEGDSGRKGLEMDTFCAWDGDILVLNILGTPGAKQDVIGKPKGHQLKVSVTAAPVGGRATDHMVRFLAKEFGVAVNDIKVVFGRFNVNKQLRIKSPKQLPSVINKHLSQKNN